MVGRDLRFGMVIQLLHYTSRKHLSTSRQQSNGLFGNRVLLDDHAGDMGCFRIKPKLKVHNEGEKVHSGDPVILEDMLTGQQLCLGSPLPEIEQEVVSVTKLRGGRRESALSAFKVRVFRSWEDRQSKDALVGGMPCTLFHTESDCYLGSRLGQSNAIELLAGPAPTSVLLPSLLRGRSCRCDLRMGRNFPHSARCDGQLPLCNEEGWGCGASGGQRLFYRTG